jgi:hypothetical protein
LEDFEDKIVLGKEKKIESGTHVLLREGERPSLTIDKSEPAFTGLARYLPIQAASGQTRGLRGMQSYQADCREPIARG